MKNSTIDKIFLNQVTCIDIFNCNWLWYLVDAVEMLLVVRCAIKHIPDSRYQVPATSTVHYCIMTYKEVKTNSIFATGTNR